MAGEPFTFNGGQYSLIVPAQNQRLPRPRAGTTGSWLHVPYGSRNIWVTDSGHMHTVWQPQGGIVIPDQDSYDRFEVCYDQFSQLVSPWGTISHARLDVFDMTPYDGGTWMGTVAWSWP